MILKFWVKKQFFRYQKKKKKEIDGFFSFPYTFIMPHTELKKIDIFKEQKIQHMKEMIILVV